MSGQLFEWDGVTPGHGRPGGRRRKVCAAEGCTNWARDVQAAKYCEEHATSINYEIQDHNTNGRIRVRTSCLVCGVDIAGPWATLTCGEHRHLGVIVKRWRQYNLTHDQIGELIRSAECWVCGRDLSWRFSRNFTRSPAERGDRAVHVDHDHRCCAGEGSCGACVRGLACPACNRRMGYLDALLNDVGADRVHLLVDKIAGLRL